MNGTKTSRPYMQFVTATISTTLVLLLLGMVCFFVLTAHNLSVYVKENINFSVLLSDDMPERDILQLQNRLNAAPYVKQTEYISKARALKEHTEAMGTDPQEFLGYNPFSASIEVKLHSAYANPDSVAVIEDALKANTDIREMLYQKDLVEAVNRNVRRLSVVLLVLAAALALISFALINNTIRLTIYAQRFLIHTMMLVGAGRGFIRRPFLLRNLKVGLLAALVACAVLWGSAYGLVKNEPGLAVVVTTQVLVVVTAAVVAFGVLITWLCGLLSVNKYLNMKADDLYRV